MSNDLVEMARLAQHDERMATGALYGDLADRIEKLEADRKKTYEALLKVTRIHEEVEAKLAKAVEVLGGVMRHMPDHPDTVWIEASETLAELTGGKNA